MVLAFRLDLDFLVIAKIRSKLLSTVGEGLASPNTVAQSFLFQDTFSKFAESVFGTPFNTRMISLHAVEPSFLTFLGSGHALD